MRADSKIKVELSNHHIHLTPPTIEALFGKGYELTNIRDLGGTEFVAAETLDVQGPKGTVKKIRVLGPYRKFDQVELLASDAVKLGVNAPVVESGHLEEACDLTLIGPAGQVTLPCGIIAARHVHLTYARAEALGIAAEQLVSITSQGPRSTTFHNVIARLHNESDVCVIHLDFEEGNAAGLKNGDYLELCAQ